MNWKKVPPVVLSCLLAFLTGALLGGFSGRVAGEDQMLAGGAIVIFHMLVGGLICLTIAGYLSWRWPAGKLWKLTLGLTLSTGLLVLLTNYVVTKKRAAKEAAQRELSEQRSGLPASERELNAEPATVLQVSTPGMVQRASGGGEPVRGFGFVGVPFTDEGYPLYFYPDSEWNTLPTDSLLVARALVCSPEVCPKPGVRAFQNIFSLPVNTVPFPRINNQLMRHAVFLQ